MLLDLFGDIKMKRHLSILLLFSASVFGATGDIIGLSIPDNGWQLYVYTENLATNKLFTLGFDTNGVATSPKITLTVNSPGFDSTGATNVKTRTFYGTQRIRFPYPDNAFPDVTLDGSTTLIKVSLSDYIGRADVVTAYTIGAAFYDAGGTPNNANSGGLTVTNLSIQTYKKPVANMSWPWNERLTGSTMPLRQVGAHWSADRIPLACIHNILTDESGDVASNLVSGLSFDSSLLGGLPQMEYFSTLDISSLTDGDLLVWRFRAFPLIGETTDIFDSQTDALQTTSTNTLPQNRPYLKKSGSYGGVAVVGTTDCCSSPAVSADGTDPTTISTNNYYLTGQAAISAVQSYNNSNYSHNDAGGGIIYYKAGVTAITTSSVNPGAMETWLTLQEYPGDTWVISAAGSSFTGSADKIKVVGAEVAITGSVTAFLNMEELWFDQCYLNTSGNGPWQTVKVIHVTRCNIEGWTFGFKPFSAQETGLGVFRQNDSTAINGLIREPQVLFGNKLIGAGTTTAIQQDDASRSASLPGPDQAIYWGNFIGGTSSELFRGGFAFTVTNGFYCLNTIFEGRVASQSALTFNSTGKASTNVFIANCLFRGVRNQWFYNETGTNATVRNYCFGVNNIHDTVGDATDTGAPVDGNRIGDWPVRWRVGHSGIIDLVLTNMPVHGYPEFRGLNSYKPASGQVTAAGVYTRFVDDQGYVNDGGAGGNGNYRLLSDSKMNDPAYLRRVIMPYDLERNNRGGWDPPGPYSSASPRKGGFFF